VKNTRRPARASYSLPLPPLLLIGTAVAASFYAAILWGPLDLELLRRYCLSHPVAIASVGLFSIGMVGLGAKWLGAFSQTQTTSASLVSLKRLVVEGEPIPSSQRAAWLAASWEVEPKRIRDSWLGLRLQRLLELQINRGGRQDVEIDLKSQSDFELDQQHESYNLLRIIHWAMPMLGFLGTVLGISQTLGQLDPEKLATQQQAAMNDLTDGLYVAFDTTAIALSLTVFSMFVQFAISRLEINLLRRIDEELTDRLIGFLATDQHHAEVNLLAPVREMATHLIAAVEALVREQALLWGQSIAESQRQWSAWTDQVTEQAERSLGSTLETALTRHVDSMRQLQDEGVRQLELRWQQWQTTFSDQARLATTHYKEIHRQTEALQQLVTTTTDVRKLEETLLDSVSRVENIGRLENAAQCVGEAVAVLATSLERSGIIRGTPTKPRPAQKELDKKPAATTDMPEQPHPEVLPIESRRKAA
jgi:biopolymer transport protein ExbB/TolQ